MEDKKPFLTIDEQIQRLKEREMRFADENGAREFLLVHNYYSVVNGYKSMFLDADRCNEDVEVYRQGTDFLYLETLYLFDRELRRQTLGQLLDVEESMRTATIYAFCEKHREEYAYLDPSCYCSACDYRSKKSYSKNLIRLLSTLQGVSENRPHKKNIAHYITKYNNVPLWVLSKCLTFGVMSNFFELQQPDVKQKAAEYLSETVGHEMSPSQLRLAYKVLSGFRNICAHEERLYCARTGKNDESSFRELMGHIAMVSTKDDMSGYASRISDVIELLSSPLLPDYISEEATKAMRVDESFMSSFR